MTTLERLATPVEIKDLKAIEDLKLPTDGPVMIMLAMNKEDLLLTWQMIIRAQKERDRHRIAYTPVKPDAIAKRKPIIKPVSMYIHGYTKPIKV